MRFGDHLSGAENFSGVTDGIMDSHGYVNIDRSAKDLCVWDFGLELCYELDFC